VKRPPTRVHHAKFLEGRRTLNVAVVGCGGNGSRFAVELKNIALSILAWRGLGLKVTLYDPDVVSESNLTRQCFYPSDLNRNKAQVLANRINCSYGLDWRGVPHAPSSGDLSRCDVVITCVDSRTARAQVLRAMQSDHPKYHLDLGNGDAFGQALVGIIGRTRYKLRAPHELHPELFDDTLPEDNRPSCGTVEALQHQDLSTNLLVVAAAHNLLWRLLRDGKLEVQGYYVNTRDGMVALPIRVRQPRSTSRHQRASSLKGAS
jgi:PRTRC genetic system ThiF family protein